MSTPAFDPTPPAPPRTLSASIWAPQPQPSETTWPKTLDSFQREAMWDFDNHHQQNDGPAHPPVRREDVFGPLQRVPGAIGDGRKKSPGDVSAQSQAPFVDADTHVEQLLRTLNLNSPAPSTKKAAPPTLNLNLSSSSISPKSASTNSNPAPPASDLPSSPDFSPASATSSLMTPTDLSPSSHAHANKSPYDYNFGFGLGLGGSMGVNGAPYIHPPSSLLFEHPSPAGRTQALETYISSSQQVNPFAHAHASIQGYGNGLGRGAGYHANFPFFEPFGEPTPATVSIPHQQHQGQPSINQSLPQTPASQLTSQNQPSSLAQPQNSAQTLPIQPRTLYSAPSINAHNTTNAPPTSPMRPRLPMDWRLQPQPQPQLQAQNNVEWYPTHASTIPAQDDMYERGSGGAGLLSASGPVSTAPASVSAQAVFGAQGDLFALGQGQGGGQAGLRSSFVFQNQGHQGGGHGHVATSAGSGTGAGGGVGVHGHEPINFLSLLHPSSSPPYALFVERIIKASDQQASIFLQQKLKVADAEERGRIVDAICARGYEMMAHRFGNWAVQRCLEAASVPEERRKMVSCMRGRVVELATNCYGCHVLQKALDCEEDIRLLIVSELLLGDPAQTLVNKHASHVWSKIMELSWTPPAPPIFAYVNKSLKGKWASLACHETGSLVVQHAFENLEAEAKDGIVDELINNGPQVFAEVAKNQWGSYCVQHILEHGSDKHRAQTLQHLLDGLLDFATSEQGAKSVTKALKEGGKQTLDRIVQRMCEAANGSRRAMIVDLALSVTGSQLIASVLPTADKDQRSLLYDCIRGHIVTLRGCKTGSKVIWLFDRMRAYYGY